MFSRKYLITVWKCESVSHSVVSSFLQPHGWGTAIFLCPWNSPGKNTGVGSHSFLQGIFPTPRDRTCISCTADRLFTIWTTREVLIYHSLNHFQCLLIANIPNWWKWSCSVMSNSLRPHGLYQAPPSMGFSRQECWSGMPFPSPRDLPNPGLETGSSELQAEALPSEPPDNSMLLLFFIFNEYEQFYF